MLTTCAPMGRELRLTLNLQGARVVGCPYSCPLAPLIPVFRMTLTSRRCLAAYGLS